MKTELADLATRVREMQGSRAARQPLVLLPAVADLIPGGMVTGAVYVVHDSVSVALALLAGPSGEGQWCGVIGVADLGAEAAAAAGVDLSRTVVVLDPGEEWLLVTSTLIEVLPLVVLRPPAGIHGTEASRLASRLRHKGTTLIVLLDRGEEWPHAEARLEVTDSEWEGLGAGDGYLRNRRLTVTARGRWGLPHTSSLWFVDGIPDPGLALTHRPAEQPDSRAS